MRISYRPRLVIKRYPDTLDFDEVGIVYDKISAEFYVCPPDLSSNSIEELTDRWLVFLRFLELIPDIHVGELFFVNSLQVHALDQALIHFSKDDTESRKKLIEMIRCCKRIL